MEKQKFSLAQLSILNASPAEMALIASNAGYDYFSMRQIYMGLPEEPDFDLSKNQRLLRETRSIMRDTGIKLLDVELARVVDEINPSSYEPAFATCAELGGKSVISSVWTENESVQTDHFAQICELAKQYELTVELEYVPIAAIKNLAGALDLLAKVKQSNAGLLIDIHHFHRAGDTIEELRKVSPSLFHMIHLCDAPLEIPTDFEEMRRIMREDRDYIGDGGIDIKSILSSIPPVPYSIELPKVSVSDKYGYQEHAHRCIQSAKEYLSIDS